MVPPQETLSDSPVSDSPPAPAPKRRGRPPGSKNKTADKDKVPSRPKKARQAKATEREKGAQQLRRVRSGELRKRADAGDPNAAAQIKKIQRCWGAVNKAKAAKSDTGKQCGERLKAVDAALANAIEAPLEVGKVDVLALSQKVDNITLRWQERSETIAGNIEARKDAAADLKKAWANFSKAIDENIDQEKLPGIS